MNEAAPATHYLVANRVDLDTFRNDGIRRCNLERTLEQTDDPPDRYHHENRYDTVKHDLQSFGFLFADIDEILNETPKENDDGERDKEADRRIEEGIGQCYGVEQSGS